MSHIDRIDGRAYCVYAVFFVVEDSESSGLIKGFKVFRFRALGLRVLGFAVTGPAQVFEDVDE